MWSPILSRSLRSGIGDDADLFLVGAQRDHRALVVELFLEDDDVTLDLVAGGLDDVQSLVEDQLLTGLERLGLDRGWGSPVHFPRRCPIRHPSPAH